MTEAVEELAHAVLRRRSPGLQAAAGDSIMMANIDKGVNYGLNPSAARIWELLETATSFDAVCAQLLEEFEIDPPTSRAQVTAFLLSLRAQGMLEVERAA